MDVMRTRRSFFYTEIINGEKKELHLCEACAAKETGMDHSFVSLTDTSFLANLLASVLGKRQETDDEENLKKTNLVCPSCHMTYNEFFEIWYLWVSGLL